MTDLNYQPLSPPMQNLPDHLRHRSTLTSASGSEIDKETNILSSTWVVITGLVLFTSAVLMIIFTLTGANDFCDYYYVLCIYQFVIIIEYGNPCGKYVISEEGTDNQTKAKSFFEVVYGYYFHCKILFCLLYCIITAVLLFMYNIHGTINSCSVIEPVSYLMGSFSIPLPLICLKMYAKARKNVINHSQSMIIQRRDDIQRSPTHQSASTNSTRLLKLKPLRQEIIQFCTGMVYISHTICYVLYPIMHWQQFVDQTNEIYHNHSTQPISLAFIYIVNQLFFRSFIGILLIQTIFAFVLVLFDPQHQFVDRNWQIFKSMMKSVNTMKKTRINQNWLYGATVILSCVIVLDIIQLISFETLDVGGMHINALKILHNEYACKIINVMWMVIHLVAANICFIYTMNFHAVANKRQHRHSNAIANKVVSDLSVNQTAFVVQTTILLILHSLDITYLFQEGNEAFNIVRQISIGGFMILQASSLYFLISLPLKKARKSFKKNTWRANGLITIYFQFLMFVNIYDFIYLSAFKMSYFHQYGLENSDLRVSYAFSFSSLTLLILFIHQLIKSYGILNKEIPAPRNLKGDLSLGMSDRSSNINSAVTVNLPAGIIPDGVANHSNGVSLLSNENVKKHNKQYNDHDPMTPVFNNSTVVAKEQSLLFNSSMEQK